MISRDDEAKPAVLDLVPASKCPLWVNTSRQPTMPNGDTHGQVQSRLFRWQPFEHFYQPHARQGAGARRATRARTYRDTDQGFATVQPGLRRRLSTGRAGV